MGVFGFVGDFARNITIHVFQDIFMPGSRTSRRIQEDINNGKTINVDFDKDNFIIFSDIHRGDGGKHDRFKNSIIYSDALTYYKDNYNLVLLGDIEECWGYKNKMESLIQHNKKLLEKERQFLKKGKYIRIIGNHDDMWTKPEKVNKFLNTQAGDPKIEPFSAVIFEQGNNKMLFIHGCQGNNFSDIGDQFASSVVNFKFSTGIVKSSLKEFEKKRKKLRKQELRILKWAKGKNMIVIIGHTHTPYFMSTPTTRFEQKLLKNIEESLQVATDNYSQKQLKKSRKSVKKIILSVEKHNKKIQRLLAKISPTVFNAGNCCKDMDEISGIEISNGVIKEVYWKKGSDQPEITRQKKMSEIFELI